MLLKLKKENLLHLANVVEQYGPAWIHGDGNVYTDNDASKFRFKYSNPLHNGAPSSSMYRVKFEDVDEIPDTVEELEKMMMDNAKKQMEKDQVSKNAEGTKVVKRLRPVAPTVDAAAVREQELDAKQDHISDMQERLAKVGAGLDDKANKLSAAEQDLASKAEQAERKEQELNARAAKLEELEKKLAAAEKTNKQPPGGK